MEGSTEMKQIMDEGKLKKFHGIMQKILKYGMVVALLAFIVLVVVNKNQFSETVAKGTPEDRLTKIAVTDGDKVVQKFKATSHTMERLDIMVDRNEQVGRAGSIEINVQDSKGQSIFRITPTLLEVDGLKDMKATMRRTERDENRWYKIVVNQKLNKGENYTLTITGKGIKEDRPLYLYTSDNMGNIFEEVRLNGKVQNDFHIRTKVWTTQIDTLAVVLTIGIALALIVLILVPLRLPEKWNKRFTWALFVINPWIAFYMVEKVFYNPISIMNKLAYGMNILWYYILFGIMLLIFNRVKYALLAGNVFLYAAAIGNYFVMAFRGNPITPADIYALGTAMDVADHYVLTYDKPAIVATVLLLALCVVACKLETYKIFHWKKRLITLAAVAVITIGSSFFLTRVDFLADKGVAVNFWEQKKGYRKNGYILSFLMNIQYTIVSEPEGYSPEKVNALADDYQVEKGKNTKLTQKPNVVVIMNETFSDLNVVNKIKTNKEVMPYINSLTENTIKGNMLVSVFGGGTSNSEYEFLTGNSVSTLPLNGNAYTQFVKHKVPSLASQLKDQGYDTIAFHPYKAHGWNRDTVYPFLGFDQFLDETDMNPNGEKFRGWYSDSEDYNKVIETFEKKEDGKPLFLFNVTIQNHGGYLIADKNFKEEIKIKDEKATDTANRYLSLIHESDRAFEKIVNYFKNQEEPTIVVMFGDHQPKLEDAFYELLYGKSLNSLSLEEQQKKYTVPYLIWANYDIDEKINTETVSANYLSSMMLEQTNLKLSPYNQFLLNLQKTIPAINANGYVTKDGKNHEFADKTQYNSLITQYQYLQYNSLMDKKHVSNKLFSVKETK